MPVLTDSCEFSVSKLVQSERSVCAVCDSVSLADCLYTFHHPQHESNVHLSDILNPHTLINA